MNFHDKVMEAINCTDCKKGKVFSHDTASSVRWEKKQLPNE